MVVGQLPPRLGVRDLRRPVIDLAIALRPHPRDQRRQAQRDLARPHLGKRDGSRRPPLLGRHPRLGKTGLGNRLTEIPIPEHRVHRQIEMAIDDEHHRDSLHLAPSPGWSTG